MFRPQLLPFIAFPIHYSLNVVPFSIIATLIKFLISGFRRDVDEIWALLGYYAASSANPLSTFRDNVSVPSSRVKKFKKKGSLDP
jgi:hypothetical protein